MKIVAAALIVLAIAAISAKLALAPFHDVLTADDCRAAYAKARTHAETVAVDFKPFDEGDRSVNTRCSMTRTFRELSSSDLTR